MHYTVSRTIKGQIERSRIYAALEEKMPGVAQAISPREFKGFNRNFCGITYVAHVCLSTRKRPDRITVHAVIDQKPSIAFFVLFALGLCVGLLGSVATVVCFGLGKGQVTKTIERMLDEVADELEE